MKPKIKKKKNKNNRNTNMTINNQRHPFNLIGIDENDK